MIKKTVFVVFLFLVAGQVRAMDSQLVLRASVPLMVSGAAALRFGDYNDLKLALQAEAGVGGGKIAFGYDSTGDGAIGYGLKAAFMRTWLEPVEVDEDQSFLGLEAELSLNRLLFNLGGYHRVGDGDDDWIVSAGVGFIF
jgi:hypothetical protein